MFFRFEKMPCFCVLSFSEHLSLKMAVCLPPHPSPPLGEKPGKLALVLAHSLLVATGAPPCPERANVLFNWTAILAVNPQTTCWRVFFASDYHHRTEIIKCRRTWRRRLCRAVHRCATPNCCPGTGARRRTMPTSARAARAPRRSTARRPLCALAARDRTVAAALAPTLSPTSWSRAAPRRAASSAPTATASSPGKKVYRHTYTHTPVRPFQNHYRPRQNQT